MVKQQRSAALILFVRTVIAYNAMLLGGNFRFSRLETRAGIAQLVELRVRNATVQGDFCSIIRSPVQGFRSSVSL